MGDDGQTWVSFQVGRQIPFKQQQLLLAEIAKHHARMYPKSVFCGYTGAAVLKIPRLGDWVLQIQCWKVPRGKRGQDLKTVVSDDGLTVINAYEILLELARCDSIASLIVSLSYCLHEELIDADKMGIFFVKHKKSRGIRKLKIALRYSSSLDESPLETLTRLYLYREVYVYFSQQVEIQMPNRDIRRVDFFLRFGDRNIVIEADGREKFFEHEETLDREKLKDAQFVQMGYESFRVDWNEVYFGSGFQHKLERNMIPRHARRRISSRTRRFLSWREDDD